jgi:hypothetical protein
MCTSDAQCAGSATPSCFSGVCVECVNNAQCSMMGQVGGVCQSDHTCG